MSSTAAAAHPISTLSSGSPPHSSRHTSGSGTSLPEHRDTGEVTVMLSTLIRNITMSPAPHTTMSSGHFVSPPQLLIQSQLSEIHHGMVQ